jgi:hypothetical protein
MNMYHAAIAALLFRSTFWDLIHKIPANAIWPTPMTTFVHNVDDVNPTTTAVV